MAKWDVKIKYGNPGQSKSSSRTVRVEAGSESMAATLAVNQFKNENSTNRTKEVDVVGIRSVS